MEREDMIVEISMRTDIPMEDVEDVLDYQDIIEAEELMCCKKRRCVVVTILMVMFVLGMVITLMVLDNKEKIDIEKTVKKYMDKLSK
ncbi:MAG: hypothetical protein IJO70_11175 [Lachnospiraceae bacterium]|nr:hypothetical protein [Lachnospiraceae bacterium]